MHPDRLTALASAAHNAGARENLHNLGGVHHDAHHATLTLDRYAPEKLPASAGAAILDHHARGPRHRFRRGGRFDRAEE